MYSLEHPSIREVTTRLSRPVGPFVVGPSLQNERLKSVGICRLFRGPLDWKLVFLGFSSAFGPSEENSSQSDQTEKYFF